MPYDPQSGMPFLPITLGPILPMDSPPGGLRFDPARPLAPGAVLAGRFEILACLDEGRCGFQYRVRDRQDHAERVLKTLDPRRATEKDADLFRREVRLLQRLLHPRIPRGFGLYAHDEMLCAPQTYVEGEDLHARVMRQGPLSEAEAREVMAQVLEILASLHSLRPPVLHRDVKPDNLLCDRDGQIWLIDFGAATDDPPARPEWRRERDWTTAQTLGYAAPEQAMGLQAYPASDLFSLAATVLFLVTGRNPVCFYDGAEGRYDVKAPLSEGFKALLEALLEVSVAARLGVAAEARARLAAMAVQQAR